MSDVVLLILDLSGIAVFVMTGALVGVRKKLDGFGVGVLATITGLGGGVLRDVTIGAVPPAALNDWRYLVVPVVTGVVVFYFHPTVGRVEKQIAVLDAIGLGLFCVTGAVKAGDFGLSIVPAALLGMVTAVGSGMMRDILAGRVPVIFKEGLYATPALAGALIAATLHHYGAPQAWYAVAVGVCIVTRTRTATRLECATCTRRGPRLIPGTRSFLALIPRLRRGPARGLRPRPGHVSHLRRKGQWVRGRTESKAAS